MKTARACGQVVRFKTRCCDAFAWHVRLAQEEKTKRKRRKKVSTHFFEDIEIRL